MSIGTRSKEDLQYLNLRVRKELIQARFELEQLKVNEMLASIELKMHAKEKKDRIKKAREEQVAIWNELKELKEKETKRTSKFVPGVGGYLTELEEQVKAEDAQKKLKHEAQDKLKQIRAMQKGEL